MSTAAELLTKSSYCRNSKHAKCKTAGCECKCHTANTEVPSPTIDAIIETIDEVQAQVDATEATDAQLQEQVAYAKDRGDTDAANEAVAELAARQRIAAVHTETVAAADPLQVAAVRDQVEVETGCGGCDNGEDCGAGCTDAAVAAARKLVIDRLNNAPAPVAAPAKKVRAPKAPKEPKPVVKGTVDGKLSNAHKRAIRLQMVTYLAAMPVDLQGDLEGVTPEEAAAYVDTYWVKYIDPARDKARHAK